MIFTQIKDYLMSKKALKFFLVKDYTIGEEYVVDLELANYLFGGENLYTNQKPDCLYCEQFLTASSKNNRTLIEDNKTQTYIYYYYRKYLSTNTQYSEGLKQRIKELKTEMCNGVDVKTRDKTEEEIKEGRTVRLLGCYSDLDKVKEDFVKIVQKKGEGKFCKPEEMVFIEYSSNEVPENFKGKVICFPTVKEMI